MSGVKAKSSKPWWWKPLWIAVLLTTLHGPLERLVGGVALTLLMVGIAYYIRVRPSLKVNRAIYILVGITPIGFILWMFWAVSGIGRWITEMAGPGSSLLISWAICYGIGAFIGDWIGKRRNYRLPLSP
jgi:hypothetical protein